MKVLLVAHHLPPRHRAGVEVHTLRLAKALRAEGCEVALYATDDDPSRKDWSLREESLDGIPGMRLAHPRVARQPADTLGGEQEAAALRSVLREVKPDAVHFHHLMYVGLRGPELCRAAGIPAVLTLHEYWMQCARGGQLRREDGALCSTAEREVCARCLSSFRFGRSAAEARVARWCERIRRVTGLDLFTRLKRVQESRNSAREAPRNAARSDLVPFLEGREAAMMRAAGHCAALLCPSRFLRNQFAQLWPGLEARMHYWPNGVPEASFVRRDAALADADRPPLRVGFLGSITPEKGVDILVRAFRELPAGTASLQLHGSDSLRPHFVAGLRAESTAAVSWCGAFSGSSSQALAEMDVLVVPSVWFENAPLVISEAFAAGVPVVASDLGGMRELVQHEHNGLLFPAGDARSLSACLRRLSEDRSLPGRLARGIAPPRSLREEARESLALYARSSEA